MLGPRLTVSCSCHYVSAAKGKGARGHGLNGMLGVLMDPCLVAAPHRRLGDGRYSPLRGLHYVLELQEAVVCRQCVLGGHLREEVVWDRGAPHELGHRVVDIHHPM